MTNPRSELLLISGPCVIEDEALTLEIARELKRQMAGAAAELVFKASFDKANRSSIEGFRGPGLEKGLKVLEKVRAETGLPVLTDVHTPEQAELVARSVDFLQVPAFLCRQTDLVVACAEAAARHGRRLNVKKGQFLAPWDAGNIVEKVRDARARAGAKREGGLWLTERGVSFGYNTLVVDMSSFQTMQGFGVPVIYDATHSVQQPGAGPGGKSTGGRREILETRARAAMAAGADGLFMEVHPEPSQAKSDGPNAFHLEHAGAFVRQLVELRRLVSGMPKLLPETRAR
ncbi:MAG: 3-deoxy-8-phosphooctulonate synthase [Bdellovibrionales bacterium]|nr:3-deoxy-8-phosphooctulonate synthase [Bdellovibrionales bacterium]